MRVTSCLIMTASLSLARFTDVTICAVVLARLGLGVNVFTTLQVEIAMIMPSCIDYAVA